MSNIVFVKHVYVQLYICTFENLINSLLNPYWQSSGAWARPNYGKFIQPKFIGTYLVLFKFGTQIGTPLDEFSRNQSVSRPGQLKFRKIFWKSFPRFANKGKYHNYKFLKVYSLEHFMEPLLSYQLFFVITIKIIFTVWDSQLICFEFQAWF